MLNPLLTAFERKLLCFHYCNFPRICLIISEVLNKIFFIKLVHTFIFVFMVACLVYILYSGITKIFNWVLLLAIIAILIEDITFKRSPSYHANAKESRVCGG